MGIALTVLTLIIIFGGIQRIAKVSEALVPFMAIGYLLIALGVIGCNITSLPHILVSIVKGAFGWHQAIGGGMGAAVMQGIKRGLFSNEAGEGSAPNVAATAYVSHPVKQGLIQALGVFTDTLVVCSCTAFIILVSGVNVDSSYNGIQLTQEALTSEIGPIGNTFIAITILLFAYSSVIGNYYYGEANIKFITKNKMVLNGYRLMVGGMVLCGSLMSLELAWSFADLMMALLAMCNLVAIVMLSKQAVWLLNDYRAQKKRGIKSPVFTKDMMPEIEDKLVSW
jgi:AGCS family alanine or glycine:cation symporter